MDEKELEKSIRSSLPVVGAILLVIASVAYIIYRTLDSRAYDEKWKDYDECGLS